MYKNKICQMALYISSTNVQTFVKISNEILTPLRFYLINYTNNFILKFWDQLWIILMDLAPQK